MIKTYPVAEIFNSIQGEGCFMGRPVTFIRLAGCNLRCPWCDTADKAFDVKRAKKMTAFEIVNSIDVVGMVVITGGEPTLYDLLDLVTELHKKGQYVALETNGTNPIPLIWGIDWITASPKPGSNYSLNCDADELKYVIDDSFSIDNVVIPKGLFGRIWLQPESAKPESAKRAYEIAIANPELGLRVGIQLHKVLGVE